MKKYPTYKDSGSAWLGDIPAHWERQTIRAITRLRAERNQPNLPLLSVYRDYGVILKDSRDDNHNVVSEDLTMYKVVKPTDLVINKMKTWQGSLGVSEHEGIVSPAYIVCELVKDLNPRFLHYLLRSNRYIAVYNQLSYGVRVDQWDMRYVDFKQIPIYLPPLDEQNVIVEYLDRKLEQIDRFIANKLRLITLLQEQQSAILNHAVTCGLHLDVQLEQTAISWVANAPEPWTRLKLGRLIAMKGGLTPSKDKAEYWSGTIPWVSPKDMKRHVISDSIDHVSDLAIRETALELINPPVTLMVVRGMILAREIPVAITSAPVTINQDMKALTVKGGCSPEYLTYLLKGIQPTLLTAIEDAGHGTKRLRTDNFKNIMVALPSMEEQDRIIRFIEQESEKGKQAISKSEREIDLIKEFRTRLISDVVLGKIDVRKSEAEVLPFKRRQVTPQFKRALLAAEIIHQQNQDSNFGRIKFQKLLYLCEYYAQLDEINSNYLRHAAGPYDSRMLYQIEAQLKRSKWFTVTGRRGEQHKYLPLEKAGEHRKYFDNHWGQHRAAIQNIISLLQPLDWEQSEIVATLFAAWNDLILMKESVTDDKIISEVFSWHEKKRRIPEARWRRALKWMREKNIIPEGYGKLTGRRK